MRFHRFIYLARFGPAWPRLGVPTAVAATFAWILLFKAVAYRRQRPRAPLAVTAA